MGLNSKTEQCASHRFAIIRRPCPMRMRQTELDL
nr:MAG TPA: hypothetical protein [Caudoviricetes sp.]